LIDTTPEPATAAPAPSPAELATLPLLPEPTPAPAGRGLPELADAARVALAELENAEEETDQNAADIRRAHARYVLRSALRDQEQPGTRATAARSLAALCAELAADQATPNR
jgi:hypothetical protein